MASRVPSFKLNNGLSLPGVGLGVWMGKPGPTDPNGRSVEDAIHHALNAGYRHIDTAALYQDEQQVSHPRSHCIVPGKLTQRHPNRSVTLFALRM